MFTHLVTILLVVALTECKHPTVTIDQGILEGGTGRALNGDTFYKFMGIPYAKPPLGELRFRAPVDPEPWQGVRNARRAGHECISKSDLPAFLRPKLTEDCLFANVYTRQLPSSENATSLKPVMVFIHGGAFISGSSSPTTYGPEYLMSKDIVLVTINYRLGVVGFLSLKDTSLGVPGNAGLKDQRKALQWVQKNIAKFGGDPQQVTLFGESAGSASVHYQVLSPSTKGLFHRAIMESGTTFNPWAYGRQNAIKVVEHLGATAQTEAEALEVLMNATPSDLLTAQNHILDEFSKYDSSQKPGFGPVIEEPNDSAFITTETRELVASGKYNRVPLIIGFNNREGLLAYKDPVAVNENFLENSIPWNHGIKKGSKRSQEIVEGLKKLYLQDGIEGMYDLFTDSYFVYDITEAAKSHSKFPDSPVYVYEVTVESDLAAWKRLYNMKIKGVCHADELGYLFKNLLSPRFESDSRDGQLVERFLTMWTNFAIHGNPTPSSELGVTWKPLSDPKTLNYLEIGDELKMRVNPLEERLNFWREIDQRTQ